MIEIVGVSLNRALRVAQAEVGGNICDNYPWVLTHVEYQH